MTKYSNTVEYLLKTSADTSGLTKLQQQIRQVEAEIQRMQAEKLFNDKGLDETLAKVRQVQEVLRSSYNAKLGMIDTKSLVAGLGKVQGGLNGVYQAFSKTGATGQKAFASLYGQINKFDTGLKQISKTSDKIFNTLGNTVRWGLIASAFSSVMNSAHESVQYVQELDKSLTNIMMVSGETKENMNEFARSANEVAQRLGATTTQMTEAAKVFVQQGMNTPQSLEMGEYAVHLANISEQDSATTSDELTAMKNAFQLNIDDMGNAISK